MSQAFPYAPDATPVIIAGAPRSGTTFLSASLNAHPQIVISNELRAWSVFNDLRLRTQQVSEILPEHPLREDFRDTLLGEMPRIFREYYQRTVDKTNVGCPAVTGDSVKPVIKAYGDKNPGYADTHNRGCLDFIADSLPDAKFIHIVRDPRSCVASYLNIDVYSNEIDRAVDMWKRHTQTMATLADRLESRVIEFRYEDYVATGGEDIFVALEGFLSVDNALEPIDFLRRERKAPVPYRSPVTATSDLGKSTYNQRLTSADLSRVADACGELAERYGYKLG